MTESKSVALPLGYTPSFVIIKVGEPTGIRTPDTRLRRPLLYPAELWTHDTMERMMRIELTPSAWKAEVLPLNYIRIKWSGRRDSNSRPSPWQGDALPLSHFRTQTILIKLMVEGGGFEPPKAQLTDLQSAPFGHSGIPRNDWSWWRESNPQPADYKSAALPLSHTSIKY